MIEEILGVPLTEFRAEGNVFSPRSHARPAPAAKGASAGLSRKVKNIIRPPAIFLLEKKRAVTKFLSPINNSNQKKIDRYYERLLAGGPPAENFVSHYFAGVEMRKDAVILDYGCGKGRSLAALSRLGYKNLIGQDIIFNDYWKRIPGSFLNIPLGCENMFPYKDESVDVLLNFMMIQTVPPALLDRHLREMIRIVKKGGYYIILERNPRSPARKRFEAFPGSYVHDLDAIQKLLENEGFKITDVSHEGIYLAFKPNRINSIRRLLTPAEKYDVIDAAPKTFFDSLLYKMLPEERRGLRLVKATKH